MKCQCPCKLAGPSVALLFLALPGSATPDQTHLSASSAPKCFLQAWRGCPGAGSHQGDRRELKKALRSREGLQQGSAARTVTTAAGVVLRSTTNPGTAPMASEEAQRRWFGLRATFGCLAPEALWWPGLGQGNSAHSSWWELSWLCPESRESSQLGKASSAPHPRELAVDRAGTAAPRCPGGEGVGSGGLGLAACALGLGRCLLGEGV